MDKYLPGFDISGFLRRLRSPGVPDKALHSLNALSLLSLPLGAKSGIHASAGTPDGRFHRQLRRQSGFSLIEQIVSVGLVAVVVPALIVLLTGLVRQASTSGAAVDMLTLARSQLESIKAEPYLNRPNAYPTLSPIDEKFIIDIAVEPVLTYNYPAPKKDVVLADEVQLITVEVRCPGCSPSIGPLILKDYKVRR